MQMRWLVAGLLIAVITVWGVNAWMLGRNSAPGTSESAWSTLQDLSEGATAEGTTFTSQDVSVQGHWRVVWSCERHAAAGDRPGACQIQVISKDGKWGDIVANTQGNDSGMYQTDHEGFIHFQVFANMEAWRIQVQQAP